jgi:hypothetical protein
MSPDFSRNFESPESNDWSYCSLAKILKSANILIKNTENQKWQTVANCFWSSSWQLRFSQLWINTLRNTVRLFCHLRTNSEHKTNLRKLSFHTNPSWNKLSIHTFTKFFHLWASSITFLNFFQNTLCL